MSLFEVHSLCKYYRPRNQFEVRALDNVSLTVALGSMTILTGPSGSGKTTLLAILAGLDRPTGGQVLFEGKDLVAFSDMELARYRRKTGFVFQDFALIANLSVEDNITYPLIAHGWSGPRRRQRARELLGQSGLAPHLPRKIHELSGGEQQRVAIVRALAGDPAVLFADEPTSNLDPESGHFLLQTFQELCSTGKTLIISSHDPRIIA